MYIAHRAVSLHKLGFQMCTVSVKQGKQFVECIFLFLYAEKK